MIYSLLHLHFRKYKKKVPTEKYAHQPEMMEHAQNIMRHFGLYENAIFSTIVEEIRWDEPARRWTIKTDRGDPSADRVASIFFVFWTRAAPGCV